MKENEKLKSKAIKLAERVLSKDLDPNDGCDWITDIGRQLGSPNEFDVISMLSHEQHGHEHVGINAKDCMAEILAECKELISKLTSRD